MLSLLLLHAPQTKLEIKVPVGTVYTYDLAFSMRGPAKIGNVSMKMKLTEKAAAREGNNTWWNMKFAVISAKGTGEYAKLSDELKSVAKLNLSFLRSPQNQLLGSKVNGQAVPSEGNTGTSDVTFPEQPVSVGSTWKSMIDLSAKKAAVTYQFLGSKTWNGKPAYLVSGTITDKTVKTTSPYRFYIEPKTCKTLYAEGAAQVATGGILTDVAFKLKRI
ncbi:MAG: hypothetical protein ABL949_12830 [Fimbriimonadaceae bacterium]